MGGSPPSSCLTHVGRAVLRAPLVHSVEGLAASVQEPFEEKWQYLLLVRRWMGEPPPIYHNTLVGLALSPLAGSLVWSVEAVDGWAKTVLQKILHNL